MDSKVVRADFGQWTDLPPGSNMLRRAAQTCSACKLAGVQIIPPPTLANQILARTFFRFRHASVCVPSRWKVLSGEFRRRPTALVNKFVQLDRVGRRGLSEPREDFSRLNTFAFPQLISADRFRGCKSCSNSPPSNRRKFLRNRLDLLFIRLHNNAQWSPKLNVTAKSSS